MKLFKQIKRERNGCIQSRVVFLFVMVQSLCFIQRGLDCIRRHLGEFYQARSGFWQGKKVIPVCQSTSVRFIYDMVILELLHNINCFKKKKLYMMIHTGIKLEVYVWVECYYQFKILLIDMIKVLCMIMHAFKSIYIFEKIHVYI
jgi:hypothetical protein